MSESAPKKDNTCTIRVSPDGKHISVDMEINQINKSLPDHLKPIYEERKRLRREARERAASEQQQSDDAPTDENKPAS